MGLFFHFTLNPLFIILFYLFEYILVFHFILSLPLDSPPHIAHQQKSRWLFLLIFQDQEIIFALEKNKQIKKKEKKKDLSLNYLYCITNYNKILYFTLWLYCLHVFYLFSSISTY